MWNVLRATQAYANAVSISFGLAATLLSSCALQVMTPDVEVTPSSAVLIPGGTKTFSATGGNPPYVFTIYSGKTAATIDSTSGDLKATAPGAVTLRVYDAGGQYLDIPVFVVSPVVASPESITVPASTGTTYTFSASGGVPPYTYEVTSGPGSIDRNTGIYTVGNRRGDAVIQITDAAGNTASALATNTQHLTNGMVNATTTLGSSLYVGGSFIALNPTQASRIAVVDAMTGDPDYGIDFKDGFNGSVYSILVSGNSAFVGGNFSSYRGTPVNYLAKVDLTTGKLDSAFPTVTVNAPVRAVGQSGSSLYVGGEFTSYMGYTAQRLAKADIRSGALDRTFTQALGFDSRVNAIQVVGSSLYLGGTFLSYRGQAASRLAKIRGDSGALDSAFVQNSGFQDGDTPAVNALLATPTALYVGGKFSQYRLSYLDNLAKLDLSNGNLDTAFTPPIGSGSTVNTLAATSSALYVGTSNLVKLNLSTGAIDSAFSPSLGFGTYGLVSSLLVAHDSLYVGGSYSQTDAPSNLGVRKLDPATGAVDTRFSQTTGFESPVLALTTWNSKVIAGGDFRFYRGVPARNIGKLNLSSLEGDATFQGALLGVQPIFALSAMDFSVYPATEGSLIKLDSETGARDTQFVTPAVNIGIGRNGLLATPSGIFAAGPAFVMQLDPSSGALIHDFGDLCYVNTDTIYSMTSEPGIALSGNTLILAGRSASDPCGYLRKINLSDYSETYYGNSHRPNAISLNGNTIYAAVDAAPYLVKIDLTTLAYDSGFSPGIAANNRIKSVLATSDAVYIAGSFTQYGGADAASLAKLDPVTGALDTRFGQAIGMDSSPLSLLIYGSTLFVGGAFTSYRNQPADYLLPIDLISGEIQ